MMDKISDVTRQDIIDVIRNGFVVSFDEPQYDSISGNYIVSYRAKISYHGRLDELGFLERLYDLDNMPSNDSRYSNAHGDISCHLRFGDYEDEYWIFQDERFSLRQGDGDEALLHFLCMMLHPSVRIENSQFTPVPVIYTNDRVTLSSLESENLYRDTMKNFVESITTKSSEWNYEKEWRIIRDEAACGTRWNKADKGALLEMIRPTSITLGCRAEGDFEKSVRKYCEKEKVTLYKMEKNKDKYQLDKKMVMEFVFRFSILYLWTGCGKPCGQ